MSIVSSFVLVNFLGGLYKVRSAQSFLAVGHIL